MTTAVDWLPAFAQTAALPAISIGAVLWKGDDALSDEGSKALYALIEDTVDAPERSKVVEATDAFLQRNFFSRADSGRFYFNVLLLSVSTVSALLSIYVYKTPALVEQLLTLGFLRQFIGNGLVVTFLVNCLTLFVYSKLRVQTNPKTMTSAIAIVAADVATKTTAFVFLTGVTYLFLAVAGVSFQGDVRHALDAIPETLMGAVAFSNLTGVYLYSVALSSFPLFLVLLIRIMAVSEPLRRVARFVLTYFAFSGKPIRTIGVTFAGFLGLFLFTLTLGLTAMQLA